MRSLLIYFTVFITGSAVLCIEILGARILAPYFGTSIYVWSALIGVTLLALSIGYFLGGIFADKRLSFSMLSYFILAAGIITLLLPFTKNIVINLVIAFELRIAVIFSAVLLFVPPLTFLGLVSPYVIKLKAETMSVVGRSAGSIYSISTVGSVVAAILTGYILVPNIGINNLITLVGIVLIITALINYTFAKKLKDKILFVVITLSVSGLITFGNYINEKDRSELIIDTFYSPYGEIDIVDHENVRYMLIDGAVHSAIDIKSKKAFYSYINVIDLIKYCFKSTGNSLLIGLGGGGIAKNYFEDGWSVDAVEIDPIVVETAYKYFGLEKNEAAVFVVDGREYINSTKKFYDVIILDAYGSSTIPFHLVTKEVFESVRNRLNGGGVFAVNIQSLGWKSDIVNTIAATLKSVFSNVVVLPIVEPPDKLGNIIIVASQQEIQLQQELPDSDYRFSKNYDMNHAWDNRFDPETKNVKVLTDNLNNIDLLSESVSILSRKANLEYFTDIGLYGE